MTSFPQTPKTAFGSISGNKRRVYVAAFGKHPGWDDHVEDLGLETDLLVRIKRVLYAEGMGGNIDLGAWDKLEESKRLPAFKHVFYWRTNEGMLLGRLWSSTDGKGRSRYPMIVCAMVTGANLSWAIENIFPRLVTVEEACKATKEAQGVRDALAACKKGLEDAAAMAASSPASSPSEIEPLKQLMQSEGLDVEGKKYLGLSRVLYEMDRELTAYRPGTSRSRGSLSQVIGPGHVRVPRCLSAADQGGLGARAWTALMKSEIVPSAPMVIIEALGEAHLDIIVGEPNTGSFFCVRANESGVSPTTLVPYTLPDEFVSQVNEKVAAWKEGRDTAVNAKPAPGDSVSAKSLANSAGEAVKGVVGDKKSWLMPAIGGGIVLVGVVVGVLALMAPKVVEEHNKAQGQGDPKAPDSAPTPKAPATEDKAPAPTPPSSSAAPATTPPSQEPKPIAAQPPKTEAAPALPPPASSNTPSAGAGGAVGGDLRSSWGYAAAEARALQLADALDADAAAEKIPAPTAQVRERLKKIKENVSAIKAIPGTKSNADTIAAGIAAVDKDVEEVLQTLGQLKVQSTQRLATHLAQLSKTPPTENATASGIWTKRLKELDPGAGWKAVNTQVEELASGLREAEKSAGALQGIDPITPILDVDTTSIETRLKAQYQSVAESVATAVSAGNREVAGSKAAEWTGYRGEAKLALAEAAMLADALTAADDQAIGTVVTALGRLRASRLAFGPEAPFAKEFAPLIAKAQRIEAISAQTDGAKVLQALQESSTGDASANGLAFASLVRLTQIGLDPSLALAGNGGGGVRGTIRPLAARLSGPRVALADSLAHTVALTSLTTGLAKAGSDFAAITALHTMAVQSDDADKKAGGTGPSVVEALPAWAKYNIQLAQLQQGIARGESPQDAVASFLGQVTELGSGVTGDPAVAPVLTKLSEAMDQIAAESAKAAAKATAKPAIPGIPAGPLAQALATLGPGSKGYTVSFGPDGSVSYTSPTKGLSTASITFLPIDVRGSKVYLSRSELSAGAFIDAVNAAGKWEDVQSAIAKTMVGGKDTRIGPRAWTWASSGPAGMNLARVRPKDLSAGWLANMTDLGSNTYYPKEHPTPAAPSAEVPVQYISPQAAGYVASLLGCRLPSVSEWTAAANASTEAKSNRRDQVWSRQFAHVTKINAAGAGAQFPNAAIFYPSGVTRPAAPQDGAAAVEGDDGFLWFAPTSRTEATGGFEDLIGNVAEFVVVQVQETSAGSSLGQVEEGFKRGDNLRVIGASALSPKAIDPMTPYQLVWTGAKEGYSDVGFRLAFSLPAEVAAAAAAPPPPPTTPAASGNEKDGPVDLKKVVADLKVLNPT